MYMLIKLKKILLDLALLVVNKHIKNQKDITLYVYNNKKDELNPCNFRANSITNLAPKLKPKTNNWGDLEKIIDLNNKVVFDIGANVGCTTNYFSKISKKVISFEPDKNNFDLLNDQIRIRQLKNVETHNFAVSNISGYIDFYSRNSNDIHSLGMHNKGKVIQTSSVQAITLDSFWDSNSEKIGLLKIDVEGFEYEVLNGSSKLLSMGLIEAILFEYSPKIHKLRKIPINAPISFLKKYDYKIFNINGAEISEDDLEGIKVCDLIALNPEHPFILNNEDFPPFH